MYEQVPEYYPAVSQRVSNILDVIGYSQEDRDRKVMVATAYECFVNIPERLHLQTKNFQYILGSRGEGSTGPGMNSDHDILVVDGGKLLVTDLTEFQPDTDNFLMVHDDHTHPGYVKLQQIGILPDSTPAPVFHQQNGYQRVDLHDRTVLSNKFVSTYVPGSIFAGPAMRTVIDLDKTCHDHVFAFYCTLWPSEALEWVQRRHRLQGWPASNHLQNAKMDGCFAVAIGHPHSHESDLEWRLSFSFTERELTRSFEDTVMKVYVLLKMIKKAYIEPVLGDAFSSYYCKVCMLWVRERTPTELWCTENLLFCLTLCVQQLYEWAREGFCPDYFIVTNNIYDRKIFGTTQLILTRLLGSLLSEDCRMLLGLKCCNLGELLLYDVSRLDMISTLRSIRTNYVVDTYVDYCIVFTRTRDCWNFVIRKIPHEYNIMTSCVRRIIHALQHAPHIFRRYLNHVLIMLLSQLGFHVVYVCKENAHSLTQEEVGYLMTFASRCLSYGINSDATSVRLKLCGLGTMLGDFDLTEICLQHMSDHKMRYMVSSKMDVSYCLKCNLEFIYDKCSTNTYCLEDLMQNQVSFSVVYLPSETSITPSPLRMEMLRSIGARPYLSDANNPLCYDWVDVDSLMCLYFFQYLNFVKLGKERHKQAALDNMIHVMRTDQNIPHRETELNLLGYCLMRESQFINAFVCFNKSLKLCPHHNAARFYLGILFLKIRIASLIR
ncbi:hypothetical protein ACJMK2_040238 [Sinanodonta woodiana]|uniref:Mab-21-like HhH/H2TH-like domain-containing protein n=1 Tax=Sinanodonta woodiana TaxID=1069815 RepID=A0ABD3WII0_SINWO